MGYHLKKKPICPCGTSSYARGLCMRCYCRHRRHGELDLFAKTSPEEAFIQRINKTDTCWLWTAGKDRPGYGVFLLPGEVKILAHRYAYILWKGPIPPGLVVMHSCDVPACVNPNHLSAGTRADNNRDAVSKNRHSFGERNGHARLTTKQVAAILSDSRSQADIAKEYGVHQCHISRIKSGRRRSKG